MSARSEGARTESSQPQFAESSGAAAAVAPAFEKPPARSEPRIAGIDSVRFWLAIWVYMSHFGFVLKSGSGSSLSGEAMRGIVNNLFDGAAAVIGFFVISGFCIHYPYRNAVSIPVGQFYIRRYVRILLPLLAAVALARLIGSDLVIFYSTILWSLIAELIYYTIYPFLRVALRRWGFRIVLSASFLIAVLVIATNPAAGNFHEYGAALTWLVGLPAWLLGCYLACRPHLAAPVRPAGIWLWRVSVWALSCVAAILRFHGGIGYPISLTALAPVLYFWMRREIAWHNDRRPVRVFEYCGQFSYSIYLFHGLAVAILYRFSRHALGHNWLIPRTLFVVLSSYVFFLAVERPGHRLARYLARSFAAPRPAQ